MLHTREQDLIAAQARLKELITGLPRDRQDLELCTYKLLVLARKDYEDRIQKIRANILREHGRWLLQYTTTALEHASTGPEAAMASGLKEHQQELETVIDESFYALLEQQHKPAYIIVLGYDSTKGHDALIEDAHTDLPLVGRNLRDAAAAAEFVALYRHPSQHDGALLVTESGAVAAGRARFAIAKSPDDRVFSSPPEGFEPHGFATEVNTRHTSSQSASRRMPGTSILVMGEYGHIRRLEGGRITFSTEEREETPPGLPRATPGWTIV